MSSKSTDSGGSWSTLNTGLSVLDVNALAIDPTTLYAGTDGGGVFAIEQVSTCTGDCDGSGDVSINELITMVNIALGYAPLSACTAGDANGNGAIEINEIIAELNNALNGCTGA